MKVVKIVKVEQSSEEVGPAHGRGHPKPKHEIRVLLMRKSVAFRRYWHDELWEVGRECDMTCFYSSQEIKLPKEQEFTQSASDPAFRELTPFAFCPEA